MNALGATLECPLWTLSRGGRILHLGCVFLGWVPGLLAAVIHVSPLGTHEAPFAGWETAATNVSLAVAQARDGDTVLLSNGVYLLTKEIVLTNALHLRSLNGAGVTWVDGQSSNRCFHLKNVGAIVEGVTIQNGVAEVGGGVRFGEGGTLRHCVVTNNRATNEGGGGVYLRWHGLVENCQILNNSAGMGDGGGVRCLSGGVVQSCVIAGNSARVGGGVVSMFHSSLINCLVVSNTAVQAGGVMCSQNARILNCTVAHNTARVAGGLHGFYGGQVLNSILYANTAGFGANYFNLESADSRTLISHCCADPLPAGAGNISLNPAWVDAGVGNYRLGPASPCIDAGDNAGAPLVDLDGVARPQGGMVDMGAYEYLP